MPNKFTEHFNLNQWEKTDKVLMEDFNADNAKLDAAFLNHRSAELIDGRTMETDDISLIQFDITQVDWSRYMALVIIADTAESNGLSISSNSANSKCIYMYQRASYPSTTTNHAFHQNASHMTAILPVFYDGRNAVSMISFGSGAYREGSYEGANPTFAAGGGTTPLEQCNFIRVTRHTGHFQPGDRIFLWGVK